MAKANPLRDIPPDRIAARFDSLGLDALSDSALFELAVALIGEPKIEADSYCLHAPLELLARFSILPFVKPDCRKLARMQIVATAVVYLHASAAAPPATNAGYQGAEAARDALIAAMDRGSVDEAQAAAAGLAQQAEADAIRGWLADDFLRRLGSAAHSHIFLHLLTRIPMGLSRTAAPMLQGFARELARDSDRRFAGAPGGQAGPSSLKAERLKAHPWEVEALVVEALSHIPVTHEKSTGGIYGIMTTAKNLGIPREFIAPLVPDESIPWDEAEQTFAGACHVAALSMFEEEPEHAKYGWTHCLTLPQAAWAIAPSFKNLGIAARIAATYVASFRAVIAGKSPLAANPGLEPAGIPLEQALADSPRMAAQAAWHSPLEQTPQVFGELATQASIRNDCHAVKYTLACYDAACSNPAQSAAFRAGAAYLNAIWIKEQPFQELVENLHKRE